MGHVVVAVGVLSEVSVTVGVREAPGGVVGGQLPATLLTTLGIQGVGHDAGSLMNKSSCLGIGTHERSVEPEELGAEGYQFLVNR